MKKQNGYTLVEILVVVIILTMTLSFGIPAFSTWKEKHQVQNQISALYCDLQFVRLQAYSEKVVWGIWWGEDVDFTAYQIRKDDTNDNSVDDDSDLVSGTKTQKFMVRSSNAGIESVGFDGRGFSRNFVRFSIATDSGAAQDCVDVSKTRIKMGKMSGGDCVPR